MLESNISQNFIGRINESMLPVIAEMAAEAAFIAPALTSFTIGETVEDESRTCTYSANSVPVG
jgi:hypothetical protein